MDIPFGGRSVRVKMFSGRSVGGRSVKALGSGQSLSRLQKSQRCSSLWHAIINILQLTFIIDNVLQEAANKLS